MQLDMMTMSAVDISVTAVLGLVLIFAWSHERSVHLVGWWGLAMLVEATSVVIAAGGAFANNELLVLLGASSMLFGCSLKWTASREFAMRPTNALWALLGPAAFLLPAIFLDSLRQAFILYSVLAAAINFGAATALGRANDKRLISYWPAVVLLAVAGLASLAWIPFVVTAPFHEPRAAISSNWFSSVVLVVVVMRIALAFVVLAMAKQRQEMEQRLSALTDSLTGLPNRRALYESLDAFEEGIDARTGPLSVLFFDLDHFKTINDTFGHETGDDVLKLFAATAHRCLPRCSIVARMGGEEFAAVLTGEQSVAAELAEKVRTRFADRAAVVEGQNICATVSVGVASDSGVQGDSSDLGALFRRADAALYAAKRLGRNRVECAEPAQMADIETSSRLAPRRVRGRRAKGGGRIAVNA